MIDIRRDNLYRMSWRFENANGKGGGRILNRLLFKYVQKSESKKVMEMIIRLLNGDKIMKALRDAEREVNSKVI